MWLADADVQIPQIEPPAIYVAANEVAAVVGSGAHKLGVCQIVSFDTAVVRPDFDASGYVNFFLGRPGEFSKRTDTWIRVLKSPEHGELKHSGVVGDHSYTYVPGPAENENEGDYYHGNDSFVLEVSGGGVTVEIHYTMSIDVGQPTWVEGDFGEKIPDPTRCPQGERWKISAITPYNLAALLAETSQHLTFANLSSSSLGEALGTGSTAQITLDTDAAGHGWFIDYTPCLSEEYLPTSDPLEWIAKPGSEAEGKMDLLTVLLHEYGHAMGLEHTVDAHDLMATTLLPGVRRLPSASEWEALRGLFYSGDGTPVPHDPFSPPGAPLPVSRGLGTLRTTRQRPTGLAGEGDLTQFDTAANPTLENSEFANDTGWSTAGDVAFASGATTLKETAARQTRLNQSFVLGPNDRFLSFTLAGVALDDVNGAPDDAFEVALIDASTGLSLLGGTGLTHNDAFLNLQADGSEYKASGVTTVRNADGSRTVLVDLAGIPAGTVVNLAFDLIGFGKGAAAASSRVTVKDLHLGLPEDGPVAHDDTAATAEDTPLDIDVAANDTVAGQAIPVLVAGPAHGSVELTPEGKFLYTPAADWSGEDSFTYRISDGAADSNVATVTLTVTPVNDAPVVLPGTVTLDEDTATTVDLLAGASDVDGDALTVTITAAPQHGSFTQNADGTWTYAPAADWNGNDGVDYTVSDGTVAVPAHLSFVVVPVNDAPVLADQSLAGFEDTPLLGNLLATASDVDSATLSATLVSGPTHGTVLVNADGSFTYTQDADWNGTDSFSYRVSDGLKEASLGGGNFDSLWRP